MARAYEEPAITPLRRRRVGARILPVDRAKGERCLYRLQVSARSTLGARSFNTGGVTVGHGWLRLLGGGGHGLPDLAAVNGSSKPPTSPRPALLLVAFDVLGGRFAINGGGLPGGAGDINYWGPDTLQWQAKGLGNTDLVHWSTTDGVDAFYADLRWEGWEPQVEAVALDEGIAVYPPLCTAEGRSVGSTSRPLVPWTELSALLDELAAVPDGPSGCGPAYGRTRSDQTATIPHPPDAP